MLMFYLWGSILHAKVPKIVLDSERSEEAIQLQSPIHRVTLYSDRSLVERKVQKRLSTGTHIVKFSDISGNVNQDSIRIDVKGGQIYRLEKELVERSGYDLEELQSIIVKIEDLQDKKKGLQAQRNRYVSEISKLQALKPIGFPSEQHRKSPIVYDTNTWISYTSFFSSHIQTLRQKVRKIDEQVVQLQDQLKDLALQSQPLLESNSKQKYEIIAVVKVEKERNVKLSLLKLLFEHIC